MKRFFPIMNDDTEKGMHFALFAYWIFAFGVMPSWMPLFGDGFWYKTRDFYYKTSDFWYNP